MPGEVGAGLVRRMGADLAVPHSPSTLMQLALHGPQPTVDISKFLASPVLPALTGYWSSAMFPSKMLKMFEDPAVGALQQFAKEMSGTTRVLTDLRATFPTVSVPSSFVNVVKPSGTVDALTAGVRIDSLLGLHGAGALASWATPPIAFGALTKLERTFASRITASFRSLVPTCPL